MMVNDFLSKYLNERFTRKEKQIQGLLYKMKWVVLDSNQ